MGLANRPLSRGNFLLHATVEDWIRVLHKYQGILYSVVAKLLISMEDNQDNGKLLLCRKCPLLRGWLLSGLPL